MSNRHPAILIKAGFNFLCIDGICLKYNLSILRYTEFRNKRKWGGSRFRYGHDSYSPYHSSSTNLLQSSPASAPKKFTRPNSASQPQQQTTRATTDVSAIHDMTTKDNTSIIQNDGNLTDEINDGIVNDDATSVEVDAQPEQNMDLIKRKIMLMQRYGQAGFGNPRHFGRANQEDFGSSGVLPLMPRKSSRRNVFETREERRQRLLQEER